MTSPLQQKLKITGPVVVTANRLSDGAVVYRNGDGGWTPDVAQAEIVTETERAKALLAEARSDFNRVVDVYLAPVALADGHVRPGNLRERIRAEGPTIPIPGA